MTSAYIHPMLYVYDLCKRRVEGFDYTLPVGWMAYSPWATTTPAHYC